MIKLCRHCQTEIDDPKHPARIFCGKACFDEWQTGRPNQKNEKVEHVLKTCAQCGIEFEVFPSFGYRKYCSQDCYGLSKIGQSNNARETNGQWKGGVTPTNDLIRKSREYDEWRQAVFVRDDFICQDCGQRGGYLHAHHLYRFADFPDLRFVVANGRTLCDLCHAKTIRKETTYLVGLGLEPSKPPDWK